LLVLDSLEPWYTGAMRFPKNSSFAVVCVWLASNCAGQKPAGPPVEPPMLGIHWQHGVD